MFDPAVHSSVDSESAPVTRQRLLDAAAQVFSDKGFRDATIREISAIAGANVAAVNYHFGDKQGLYREVLRHADRCAAATRHFAADQDLPQAPREQLAMFIRAYLAGLVESGKLAWHSRLIARELQEPSPALDMIVNENIRPRSQMLSDIVRDLLSEGVDRSRVSEHLVNRCKFSIIGQCLIYHSGRHVVERLHSDCSLTQFNLDEAATHITAFSLAAIDGLRRRLLDDQILPEATR